MTNFDKHFDEVFAALLRPAKFAKGIAAGGTYPPYNIIRVDANQTVIELAVAGFKETEISVSEKEGSLIISGAKDKTDIADYIYKGIGARSFERVFELASGSIVEKAEYSDGILSVFILTRPLEETKTKTIEISRGQRQYLTERDDII